MPNRPLPHHMLVVGLTGSLLLAACQGVPGNPPADAPRIQLPPASGHGHSLRVTVHPAERQLMALAADVKTLVITVRAADGREYAREILLSPSPAGPASSTFTGLPPGPTQIQVTALAATQEGLGRTERLVTLEGGATTEVSINLRLFTPRDVPSPTPTGATVGITLVDGPVLPGPPVPSPTPKLFLGRQLLKWDNFAYMSMSSSLAADSRGYIWVLGVTNGRVARVAPDASVTNFPQNPVLHNTSFRAMAIDSQDNVWLAGNAKLQKVSSAGTPLAAYNVPALTGPSWLAVDATDHIWVASGRKVCRVSPTGVVLNTHDLSADVGEVAVDRTTGTAWVLLPHEGNVLRFSAAGTTLPAVTINQTSDALLALAVDAQGNAWVGQNLSGAVAKIAPDGQHLGLFATDNPVARIVFDPQGNAIVGPDFTSHGLSPCSTKLSPEGRVLGHYRTDYFVDAVIDVAGNLWCLSLFGPSGTYLLKFTL